MSELKELAFFAVSVYSIAVAFGTYAAAFTWHTGLSLFLALIATITIGLTILYIKHLKTKPTLFL